MFEYYYHELMNFCARRTRSRDAAADVVQETYARVLSAQHSAGAVKEPRALLYRIARNLIIDGHRRDVVQAPASTEDLSALPDVDALAGPRCLEPEVATMAMQGMRSMLRVINELPPRCQQAFILHRFDGLSHVQVADQMGISRKMVEQHIKLAMQACRLERDADDTETNAGRTKLSGAEAVRT